MFGKTSGNNTFKNKYPVAVSSTRKGRVGRVLFEFEERWFSLAEAIFRFLPPKILIPPWGKEQATGVEIWPPDESVSTHVILSGGREKLAVAGISNRTWLFSPDKSL